MSEDKGSLHQLTHRFFRFLEKEYDFSYDYGSNTFTSEIMSIHVSSDQLEPIVTVWFKSEPEFTRMNFKWYVYFLEKNDLLQSSNLEATLEKNFAYFALLLHRHLRVIMESKTSMLLQVLKFFFESSARDLRMSGEQLTAQFQSYKLRYDYIKQIDPSWSI